MVKIIRRQGGLIIARVKSSTCKIAGAFRKGLSCPVNHVEQRRTEVPLCLKHFFLLINKDRF